MLPAPFTAILKLLYCDTFSNVQDPVVGSDDLFTLVVNEWKSPFLEKSFLLLFHITLVTLEFIMILQACNDRRIPSPDSVRSDALLTEYSVHPIKMIADRKRTGDTMQKSLTGAKCTNSFSSRRVQKRETPIRIRIEFS